MVFISTLLSSSLGSRFSNTLESHQIDDDYSGQYDFDTVESSSSSSSLPQSQRQVSSTNLSSGLSSYPDRRVITETTAATATINASNFSSPPSPPRQSLASTPTQPSNCVAVADIDTRFPPSSAAINQYDPYEEVPSYEASQRMHNQSANSNSNNNSSSNIAHNNDNYITEDVSHIAPTTHIYTPIPSLPIPITSSTTGISYGNSYDALINNNNNNSSTSNSNNDNRNGIASNSTLRGGNIKRSSIKQLGLKFLNARQHFLLASCRDVSLIPPLIGLIRSWRMIYSNDANNYSQVLNGDGVTLIRGSEHFLTGLGQLTPCLFLLSLPQLSKINL
ncbi:hypothetical protein L150_06102 [Candida albicans Ca529L]|nr:hypothetical protein L150_06102 [Candida albicans Ca529L]